MLWGLLLSSLHFTDEETKIHRNLKIIWGSAASKWQNQVLDSKALSISTISCCFFRAALSPICRSAVHIEDDVNGAC